MEMYFYTNNEDIMKYFIDGKISCGKNTYESISTIDSNSIVLYLQPIKIDKTKERIYSIEIILDIDFDVNDKVLILNNDYITEEKKVSELDYKRDIAIVSNRQISVLNIKSINTFDNHFIKYTVNDLFINYDLINFVITNSSFEIDNNKLKEALLNINLTKCTFQKYDSIFGAITFLMYIKSEYGMNNYLFDIFNYNDKKDYEQFCLVTNLAYKICEKDLNYLFENIYDKLRCIINNTTINVNDSNLSNDEKNYLMLYYSLFNISKNFTNTLDKETIINELALEFNKYKINNSHSELNNFFEQLNGFLTLSFNEFYNNVIDSGKIKQYKAALPIVFVLDSLNRDIDFIFENFKFYKFDIEIKMIILFLFGFIKKFTNASYEVKSNLKDMYCCAFITEKLFEETKTDSGYIKIINNESFKTINKINYINTNNYYFDYCVSFKKKTDIEIIEYAKSRYYDFNDLQSGLTEIELNIVKDNYLEIKRKFGTLKKYFDFIDKEHKFKNKYVKPQKIKSKKKNSKTLQMKLDL